MPPSAAAFQEFVNAMDEVLAVLAPNSAEPSATRATESGPDAG